jgi:hypothetical protein
VRLCVLSSCCIKFNIFRSHQKSKQCHWQLDQPASASAARCSQATSLESSLLVDPRDGRSGSSDQVVAAVLGRWSWGIRCLFGSVSTHDFPRGAVRNGIFRDTVRCFIKGDAGKKGDFATRTGKAAICTLQIQIR